VLVDSCQVDEGGMNSLHGKEGIVSRSDWDLCSQCPCTSCGGRLYLAPKDPLEDEDESSRGYFPLSLLGVDILKSQNSLQSVLY
jgi:hypothetical protein